MAWALGIGLVVFFSVMVGISLWASRRIETGEDYIVAGRGLSGIMTTATIMATWYAAETILVTADAVRSDGLPRLRRVRGQRSRKAPAAPSTLC